MIIVRRIPQRPGATADASTKLQQFNKVLFLYFIFSCHLDVFLNCFSLQLQSSFVLFLHFELSISALVTLFKNHSWLQVLMSFVCTGCYTLRVCLPHLHKAYTLCIFSETGLPRRIDAWPR